MKSPKRRVRWSTSTAMAAAFGSVGKGGEIHLRSICPFGWLALMAKDADKDILQRRGGLLHLFKGQTCIGKKGPAFFFGRFDIGTDQMHGIAKDIDLKGGRIFLEKPVDLPGLRTPDGQDPAMHQLFDLLAESRWR